MALPSMCRSCDAREFPPFQHSSALFAGKRSTQVDGDGSVCSLDSRSRGSSVATLVLMMQSPIIAGVAYPAGTRRTTTDSSQNAEVWRELLRLLYHVCQTAVCPKRLHYGKAD